jgi:hypothetical protein
MTRLPVWKVGSMLRPEIMMWEVGPPKNPGRNMLHQALTAATLRSSATSHPRSRMKPPN